MESAAVSISAMFCMTVGLNINKNIYFFATEVSTCGYVSSGE